MKRIIAALAVFIIVTLVVPVSAIAGTYSQDSRVSANLSSIRICYPDVLGQDVFLRNGTNVRRWFKTVVRQNGIKIQEDTWIVPHRTRTALSFYVAYGESIVVNVIYRGELIMHRRITGIC